MSRFLFCVVFLSSVLMAADEGGNRVLSSTQITLDPTTVKLVKSTPVKGGYLRLELEFAYETSTTCEEDFAGFGVHSSLPNHYFIQYAIPQVFQSTQSPCKAYFPTKLTAKRQTILKRISTLGRVETFFINGFEFRLRANGQKPEVTLRNPHQPKFFANFPNAKVCIFRGATSCEKAYRPLLDGRKIRVRGQFPYEFRGGHCKVVATLDLGSQEFRLRIMEWGRNERFALSADIAGAPKYYEHKDKGKVSRGYELPVKPKTAKLMWNAALKDYSHAFKESPTLDITSRGLALRNGFGADLTDVECE